MKANQICENFRGQHVILNGIKLSLEELCSGVLITGAIGSGKTVSWANRLAKEIASLNSDDQEKKSTIIYFNTKGSGARQFLEKLPESRRSDVIHLTGNKDCSCRLSLFEIFKWNSPETCRAALVAWIEEVMTQVFDSSESIDHDRQFWLGQRLNILNTLASLDVLFPGTDPNFFNALHALLWRVENFLDFVNQTRFSKKPNHELKEKFKAAGFNQFDLMQLRSWISHHRKNKKRPSLLFEQFMNWSRVLLDEIDPMTASPQELHPFDNFWKTLTSESKKKAEDLFFRYCHLSENTWSCVATDLQSIVSFFRQEPLNTLLSPHENVISIEQVVDEGKILIIDCPCSDSGGGSRGALVAIKIAVMNRLLGRYQLSNHIRPIALLIDEFHSVTTKGKTDGDDMFISRCREMGIITIFATQNLSLLKGVLRSNAKVFGLVSNLKTKVFASNDDLITNEFASMCLGLKKPSLAAIPWQKSNRTIRVLQNTDGNVSPIVTPMTFVNLQRGEAYIVTPSSSYHINANTKYSKPIVEILREEGHLA
ncbi:MAG: type IV secretion system DNA-binding domain-containing protein [Verrucomicrobiota bacterium]